MMGFWEDCISYKDYNAAWGEGYVIITKIMVHDEFSHYLVLCFKKLMILLYHSTHLCNHVI